MGLVVTLNEGGNFVVGTDTIELQKIVSPTEVILSRQRDGQQWTIYFHRPTFILKEVSVLLGHRSNRRAARLVVEAPRSIVVHR